MQDLSVTSSRQNLASSYARETGVMVLFEPVSTQVANNKLAKGQRDNDIPPSWQALGQHGVPD